MRVVIAGLTDVGQRRERNEDRIWVQDDSRDPAGATLLIVADGMGGAAAGNIASREAVQEASRVFYEAADVVLPIADRLRRALEQANARVHQAGETNPSYSGMGSTMVAAAIHDGSLWVANVGDSRCYVIRDGTAIQITQDHSWVAEQFRAGRMSEEEASRHSNRNVITRVLGESPSVSVDLFEERSLEDGDAILLCSDGLSGVVDDGDIATIVQAFPPERAVRNLVALANDRGGPDNISVILASTSATEAGVEDEVITTILQLKPRRSRTRILAAGSAVVALVAVALIAGFFIIFVAGGDDADEQVLGAETPVLDTPARTATAAAPASAEPTASGSGDVRVATFLEGEYFCENDERAAIAYEVLPNGSLLAIVGYADEDEGISVTVQDVVECSALDNQDVVLHEDDVILVPIDSNSDNGGPAPQEGTNEEAEAATKTAEPDQTPLPTAREAPVATPDATPVPTLSDGT